MNRVARFIPYWLAWPFSVLSTLAAFAGAGFLFYIVAFGDGDLSLVVPAAGCMAGGAADPDILSLDDRELVDLCLKELGGLYGLQGRPDRTWIIRWEKAIAQFEPGHLARLASIDGVLQRMPGLFLAGSSYRGVSINHCVAEAEKTAAAVLEHLLSAAPPVHAAKES